MFPRQYGESIDDVLDRLDPEVYSGVEIPMMLSHSRNRIEDEEKMYYSDGEYWMIKMNLSITTVAYLYSILVIQLTHVFTGIMRELKNLKRI
jgi:hypothetical protein